MTILVTGAAGFVGSHVARQLVAAGERVASIVRPGSSKQRLADVVADLEVFEADIGDPGAIEGIIRRCRPTVCIHLAWYAQPERYLEAPDNIGSLQASLGLIEALERSGCEHFVGVGTCAEYELGTHVVREDECLKPSTLYAAAKLSFALVAERRLQLAAMGFAWGRLFYMFGPHEDRRRLVPAAINSLLEGRVFSTTAGEQVRDYLRVEDVAAALCALAREKLSGTFNVCSGEAVTIAELITTLGRLVGRPELVRLGALPYREWDPMYVVGDNAKIRLASTWAPHYPLRESLAQNVEWWRQQR